MRVTAWKPHLAQTSPRSATPPPPAWEPFSPVHRPDVAPIPHPAGANRADSNPSSNGINGAISHMAAQKMGTPAQLRLSSPAVTYEPSLRSAPLPQHHYPYSPALGSPIEALADAAVSSMHASSSYNPSARRFSNVPTSPTTVAHPPAQRAPKHAYPVDSAYPYDERPAKRARSEYFSPPQYGQYRSRPATSHIPGWSYNVEHMAEAGQRMYQDNAGPSHRPEDSTQKRLSDAQLLMDFAFGASQTTPRPASTAKRWSIPHPEVANQHLQHPSDASHPHLKDPPAPIPQSHPPVPSTEHKHAPGQTEGVSKETAGTPAAQTQTPPEDAANNGMPLYGHGANSLEQPKTKKHQGWPKGKSRGPRNGSATGKKKKSTPKPREPPHTVVPEAPEQLHSPQSLSAEQQDIPAEDVLAASRQLLPSRENAWHTRRHSFSTSAPEAQDNDLPTRSARARSVPLGTAMGMTPPADETLPATTYKSLVLEPDTICAGCNSSDSEAVIGDGEQWIRCDGCKEWYHFACAGFKSERDVRDVDKFFCLPCKPKFGDTTKVRKSARAHTAVDYAGLNEGILKTSDDNPEHHYISAFKNGDIEFTPETFARLPPELISADYLEKTNGFKEPILVPSALNPRPSLPGNVRPDTGGASAKLGDLGEEQYGLEMVPDDGQDKLDMVIPEGLTVRRVSELYGPQERVPVIDVKAQEGEDKRWTMGKWADYYEQQGEKPVRNVISLEVSRSRLGKLIRRPKAVREMDLQDSVWREDDKRAPPAVQFYCLMSVADCYTDFHIDFGGSSVYYHIVKGKKVFFFIPPSKQNLKKYEDWCLSPKQGHEFLGQQVKDCYRVDLYPGDTMLIPSGWIHAVWTPEDSLVIGGNFLTRIHYGMQIKILEIEKNTKVALKFRYPYFQKIMWLSLIKYLEEDPLPASVRELLLSGGQFKRDIPIFCETDRFGHNSHPGLEKYNRRYYAKAELEGLTDLANYIWRTVMISLGKIDGITETVRKAVTSSIPRGHGEPLVLIRRFAMWVAWKRGNESIPQWVYPDAALDTEESSSERKMSQAQANRMERESWRDGIRATGERHSTRIKSTQPSLPSGAESQSPGVSAPLPPSTPAAASALTGLLQPTDRTRPLTTPKTSQLGPKRIACDACRKRRIRCKHKDELLETKAGNGLNGSLNTIDLSGSFGLSVKRRYSDLDGPIGQQTKPTVMNGGPLLADVNADPYALKSGRVKACADCRKSKRRCIHDEYGNVDPIKVNEVPIPRGAAHKKRRISEENGTSSNLRTKSGSAVDGGTPNGVVQRRSSMPNALSTGRTTELQSIAFSAQQALDEVVREDTGEETHEDIREHTIPIDPALQSYVLGTDSIRVATPSRPPHQDAIMSSIEIIPNDPMEGIEDSGRSERQGPSVEPLTPGPGPRSFSPAINEVQHGPSLSPPLMLAPTVALPVTPRAPRSSRNPSSARTGKASHTPHPSSHGKSYTPKSTPGGRRWDSKETIKVEPRQVSLAMAMSPGVGESEEDMASLQLALQLQMEEHGLRRRSK